MTSQLLECEALAQKLYDECRRSSSPYYALRSSLRKLRNILSDVDDIWHDGRDHGWSKIIQHISQCSLVLEKLNDAFSSHHRPKQDEVDTHVLAFDAQLVDLSLEFMTDYEHMTISNATSIDLSRTASSPTSVSVLVPSSTSTSQGSASAPRQASNTDPDLTCGLLRVNAKRADAPLWVGKSSVHQHGSFTASTDLDDVSDLGDTDRSQAAVAIAEKSVELASSAKRPPSLLDCEAAHKLMVEALQKKLGSRDDSAVDGPARVPMPPTISNGQGSDLQDRHHKVPPLESACIAGREINCARSLITGRFSKDEGAMIRMGKTPPPVPPKRPSMPVCPKRHPPPPPPRHQPRSVSECREQVNTTSAVRLSSPRTASLDDLCHASGFHSRTPAEPPVPEISPDAGHIPSGNQVYEHTSTATDFKALLDMNFSCPLEFDLPFMADDEEIGPLPITRPSRPAKVKAVALNKEGTQTQKEPPVRLPGSEGVDENGPSPRHLEVPTFHTLPSRWRGGKQGKARQVSAPCSTICEGIKSHVSISAEQIELGSSTGNADCPSTSEQQSEGHSLTRIGACPKINGHLELPLSSRDFHGYYGEEVVLTPKSSPDHKHINIIVPSWNNSSWDHAEIYLRDLSATLLGTQDRDCLRRVQHLTAVCASLRGKWDEAIRRFIACLRTPIASLQDLDDGDCAAAYWLGDLYAMQNRRVDAGIAYALAKRSSLAIGTPNYRSNLRAERCAVQLGTSESADTASTANQGRRFSPSILEDGVLCADVTRFCTARGQSKTPSFEQRRSRNSYLAPEGSLANRLATLKQMSMTISAESFRADSPWPMPYDPLFAMANVQQGRILPHEGQIVVVPNTSSFLKLPRLLSVHALQCFICNDLAWLITALRTCLKDLDIKFAEIVDEEGIRFHCRYASKQQRVATTHYFPIALLRHPLWSGHYVVDVRAEREMCSSRLVDMQGQCQKGVRFAEARKMRKMITRLLERAAKNREQN